jgi:pimeloyl-ACP methyl ester carboxylesterase
MNVQPFNIDIKQSVLDDLQERLKNTRWTDEVESAGWDYGTNLAYLKELVDYWQNQFDWRAQEAKLNRFAQFRAKIDGLGIHFIHERGKGSNPLPIILTHGWPDSFYRFYKIIPMLTDPKSHGADAADAFDVIVPCIPGFGFSDRSHERGMTTNRTADLWARLMTEVLGYGRFAAHGGDGGSPISQHLALKYSQSVVGIHLTDLGWHSTMNLDPSTLSEAEQKYLNDSQSWSMQEGAYAMVQMTKPQTLAYELNDSPVGLAAWIVDRFRVWSDCDGDLERSYSKDELLTNIMIYWVTETINSSIRGYYEEAHTPSLQSRQRIDVPAGLAIFLKDFPPDLPPPRELAERSLNVQRWTEMPHGGHFAALEEPELLAEDIRAFFRTLR